MLRSNGLNYKNSLRSTSTKKTIIVETCLVSTSKLPMLRINTLVFSIYGNKYYDVDIRRFPKPSGENP